MVHSHSCASGWLIDTPIAVNRYSTFGGTTGKTVRSTRPWASRARSVWVSIFCETPALDGIHRHPLALAIFGEQTRPVATLQVADFNAIVVAGGQAPMFTFEAATALGFDAIDAGPLVRARQLEQLAALWVSRAFGAHGRNFAVRLVRR